MTEYSGSMEKGGDGVSDPDARVESLEETIAKLRKSLEMTSVQKNSRLLVNLSEGNTCQLENGTNVSIAGLGRRVIAAVADNLFFAMMGILGYCLMVFVQSAIAAILVFLFGALVGIGYHMTMLTNRGQTLGRKMANVQVVMFEDGTIPDAIAIVKRGAVATGLHVIPWVLMIPAAIIIDTSDGIQGAAVALVLLLASTAIWCIAMAVYYLVNASFLWNITGQGWHDRVAGTIVIATNAPSNRGG